MMIPEMMHIERYPELALREYGPLDSFESRYGHIIMSYRSRYPEIAVKVEETSVGMARGLERLLHRVFPFIIRRKDRFHDGMRYMFDGKDRVPDYDGDIPAIEDTDSDHVIRGTVIDNVYEDNVIDWNVITSNVIE